MNMIATLVLALLAALLVPNRRIVLAVTAGVWLIGLPPTVHAVLLQDQLEIRSWGNTISFFVVNDVALALSVGLAVLVHRRRFRAAAQPAAGN